MSTWFSKTPVNNLLTHFQIFISMDPVVTLPFETMRRISVPSRSVVHSIDARQIVRVQSSSNYSKIFFNSGKTLVVAKVLRWFEDRLAADGFMRVHRTHLINTGYILQYYPDGEGSKLELTNGDTISISKRKKSEFLKLIKNTAIVNPSASPRTSRE
jgi:two-component system LytT family response regulator